MLHELLFDSIADRVIEVLMQRLHGMRAVKPTLLHVSGIILADSTI
jgi:hypothetical protein